MKTICAWCGEDMPGPTSNAPQTPPQRVSHGLCEACASTWDFPRVENLYDLSKAEADALPMGRLLLDRDGTILSYNRTEADLAGLEADRVVGRNFFQDVAPCTAVKEFQGRFQRLVASQTMSRESFDFLFKFRHGTTHVELVFVHEPGLGTLLLVRPKGTES